MTIPEYLKQIAQTACPTYHWYYDVKSMQNVAADNAAFPAIWMEEYYGRTIDQAAYQDTQRLELELHFQNLVPMQGVALDREVVRDQMLTEAVKPFIKALQSAGTFGQITSYRCDPEPPMFDANTTGLLVQLTIDIADCAL